MLALFAILASGAFLVRLVPQPLKLARTGCVAGVSTTAALNATVAAMVWTLHGITHHQPVVTWVSLASLVPCAWTVALLWRVISARDLAWAAGWLAVALGSWATPFAALVLSATVVVTNGPQVAAALRQDDLDGLAPGTWWWMVADGATWSAYGTLLADPALVGYGIACIAMGATVLRRLHEVAGPLPLATAPLDGEGAALAPSPA